MSNLKLKIEEGIPTPERKKSESQLLIGELLVRLDQLGPRKSIYISDIEEDVFNVKMKHVRDAIVLNSMSDHFRITVVKDRNGKRNGFKVRRIR